MLNTLHDKALEDYASSPSAMQLTSTCCFPGVVVLMMDERMEASTARDMLRGAPDALQSEFHLSYNMLLNMLRYAPHFHLFTAFAHAASYWHPIECMCSICHLITFHIHTAHCSIGLPFGRYQNPCTMLRVPSHAWD